MTWERRGIGTCETSGRNRPQAVQSLGGFMRVDGWLRCGRSHCPYIANGVSGAGDPAGCRIRCVPREGGGEQKGGASLSAQLGQVLFGFLNTGIRSFPVPPFRFGEIFRDAIAVFITPAHLELCNGIPLFSSLSVPLYGFCVVLFDAFAPVIAGAQIVLCTGIPLFSGLSVPLYGFCVVFCNAFAIVITIPETVLCDTVSRFGRFAA